MSDNYPEGRIMSEGTAILYTQRLPVEIEIFKRICFNGNCVARWTGEKECIHRSSQKIAAGYKFRWEYVYSIKASKQTFSLKKLLSLCNFLDSSSGGLDGNHT